MPGAAIPADLRQALDVQCNLTAEVALDGEVLVDHFTKCGFLILGQILDADIRVDLGHFQDLLSACSANTVDVGQTDLDSLLTGQVNTSNTCHLLQSTSY